MVEKGSVIKGAKVLVLGITFKENCPDIRNSRVIDVISELKSFGIHVDVYDPLASNQEVKIEYNIDLIEELNENYEAIILAVGHDEFKNLDFESHKANKESVIYDVKGFLPKKIVTARL